MNAQERLRQAIEKEEGRLRGAVPGDQGAAILAVLRQLDALPQRADAEAVPDLVAGRHIADLGGNKALQLCLESRGMAGGETHAGAAWGEEFLQACERLAEAELVLGHVETGFMRIVEDGDSALEAWIATKRVPTNWRERADIDWWASWLGKRYEAELHALEVVRPSSSTTTAANDAFYRRIADVLLKMMDYQLSYPPEATIGGCTIRTYDDVLREILARALRGRDRGDAVAPQSTSALIGEIAQALAIDPPIAERAMLGFTLDEENAAYHAAVPGAAAAPVVRVGADRIVLSWHGLCTEPLLFLTRELRRRFAEEYHNAAHLRE